MNAADLSHLKANSMAMAGRLKLMSHPERLLMLCRLDEGEASVGELVALAGLSQSSVSQHLAMLRDEGVVSIRGEAQTRFYKLTDPMVSAIIRSLCDLCDDVGNEGQDTPAV
ncbi:MAG: helix-turn-helix transcriptional regulator [Sphingomonadales bacterium]|nr:helix-turn-helix transcriptional regulator [Sphingomonadales bacterium]